MALVNENYLKLRASYLFSEIARRVSAFQKANPSRELVRLGIGDVTLPLPAACVGALHRAVDEMASAASFRGYGPEQGYEFLRERIAQCDFAERKVDVSPDEIFVSDGSKCDTANIQELFSSAARVAVPDPVYPVYVDTNVMAGRTGEISGGRYAGLTYMPCTRENEYMPAPPEEKVDLIYLCSPNNPTGAAMGRAALRMFVDYARKNRSIILFDAAYESFIRDERLPHSIFEIDGAREVAVEFRSFSKTAGFTGTRCAYTVVPKDLQAFDSKGRAHGLHALWNRRHTTKFNGVSYPVQRAAEAVYSAEGRVQVRGLSDYYLKNARIIRQGLAGCGYHFAGGENAPYVWVCTEIESWQFFDSLLQKAGVVCTPGVGFGECGEKYARFSSFNSRENVEKAVERIAACRIG